MDPVPAVAAVAAAAATICICCRCGLEFGVEEMQQLGRGSLCCNYCNGLIKRIQRLPTTCREGLKDIKGSARQAFYQQAKDMFDSQLAKTIQEHVVLNSIRTSTRLYSEHGDFDKYDELEQKYKDKPEAWAQIKKNAVQITHPVSKEKLVWMPQISMSSVEKEEHSESKKRSIDMEHVVKPKKQPRPEKKRKEEQEDGAPADVDADLVEIPSLVLQKLEVI